MAQGKTAVVTKTYLNNSTTATTIKRTVDKVVIDNNLVPDPREENPGVIIQDAGR